MIGLVVIGTYLQTNVKSLTTILKIYATELTLILTLFFQTYANLKRITKAALVKTTEID